MYQLSNEGFNRLCRLHLAVQGLEKATESGEDRPLMSLNVCALFGVIGADLDWILTRVGDQLPDL